MHSKTPAAKTAPAVRLEGVGVAYSFEKGSYPAVKRADLTIEDGEFLSIVGPTGCGKTTLLNLAAGMFAPSEGRIEVLGQPLLGLNPSAGYLFQADALFPWKTALENVAIGLEVAGIAPSEARTRARVWLARVGLSAFAGRYPHMLSGGQKKRVGLAQVLIRDPKILLMDEPFGPLDAQTRHMQRGEHPRQRRRPIDVAKKLALVHASSSTSRAARRHWPP